jgi:hypothetical protein
MQMFSLYKFTCTPNYPVCEAGLVFISDPTLTEKEVMANAQKLAKEDGCFNVTEAAKLTYIGELILRDDDPLINSKVIWSANGEY